MNRRDFVRISALGTVGAAALSFNDHLNAAPTLLAPGDLQYKGLFLVPDNPSGTTFGYSNGALAGRYVNGQLRLFISGTWNGANLLDPVYEISYPGIGASVSSAPRATLVGPWGDIYQNRRLNNPGALSPVTRGLLWANGMLWWAYGGQYNVTGSWDPSIGVTVFNDATGTFTSYGPWRTQDHSQKTRGYMASIPQAFATQYTGGNTVAVGAPTTSGNANSPAGAWLTAMGSFNPLTATPDTLGSTHVTIGCQDLIARDATHPQLRPAGTRYHVCGWNVLYNCSGGSWIKDDPTFLNGGIEFDIISACAWIQTPTKQGLVMFGQVTDVVPGTNYGTDTVPHLWYGPDQVPCCHGQPQGVGSGTGAKAASQVPYLWIYDPTTLGQAALGKIQPSSVVESVSSPMHPMGAALPYPITSNYQFGGAFFDSVSGMLFVSDIGGDSLTNNFDIRPVIHVFQVGTGSTPPSAPTNLRIVP
jgi:hypothetical protein